MATPEEKELLEFIFGEATCTNSRALEAIDRFAIALLAALLYVIFSIPAVDRFMSNGIPHQGYKIFFIGLIIFIIVLIFNNILTNLRSDQTFCEFTK